MDVYSLAKDMLGGVTLGANEVAALRAIDREYWQRVYALRAAKHAGASGGVARTTVEPTAEEAEELREWMTAAIRGILPGGDRPKAR